MIYKDIYPILEFDDDCNAVINPSNLLSKYGKLGCDTLVISFFREAIDQLVSEGALIHNATIPGENKVEVYKFKDDDVLMIHGTVGAPACAGILDLLIGLGVRRVIFCGGGGVLDKSISVGKLMICTGAIRDEGFSYHYIKPSRIIYSSEETNGIIRKYLKKCGADFIEGLAWTTDAVYRETREKVALRRSEGAKIVEMEQAACIAVTQFRGVKYGAILYGGDDVSGETCEDRAWKSRHGLRYDLILLCKEIVKLF